MPCFSAGAFNGRLFDWIFIKSYNVQSPPLVPYYLRPFLQGGAHEFPVFPSGLREEAMGWTMTLKDDFVRIRRAEKYLSLFLLFSLFTLSVWSDITFPKDRHFLWKAGKTIVHCKSVKPMCLFWLFTLKSLEKNNLIWSITILHIYRTYALWNMFPILSLTHTHTQYTLQKLSYLLFIMGERHYTTTSIFSAATSAVCNPLSDIHCREHKPM